MKLDKFKKWISILALVILVAWLFRVDYSNLSWKTNGSAYLGIVAMFFIVLSGIKYFKK